MEFQVLSGSDGSFFISDSYKVEGFDVNGKRMVDDIPTNKFFREMAYVTPPVQITAGSFEKAKEKFLETARQD